MQMGGLRRWDDKPLVVPRQIVFQEAVRGRQRWDARKPQFLDQPILEVGKQPPTRPLACGEWAGITLTPNSVRFRSN
jgi:hypothetical protein